MRNWLEHRASNRPETRAVRFLAGGREATWSYGELARRTARAAAALETVQEGERAGLGGLLATRLAPTDDLEALQARLLAVHAAAWLGRTLLPLHPDLPREEARRQLEEIARRRRGPRQPGRRLLVTDEAASSTTAWPWPTVALAALLAETPSAEPSTAPRAASQDPDLLATVLFTSGTTGTPRPVPLTWGNHLASALASATNLGIAPEDDWLSVLPLHHIGGLAIHYRCLVQGTAVTLLPRFEPDTVAGLLASGEITVVSLVPTMLRRLLAGGATPHPHLRAVLLGGGPADRTLLEEAAATGWPVLGTYGMTETASGVVTVPLGELPLSPEHLGSAGRPVFGAEIEIRGEDGRPLPAGASGALHVRGPMVSRGWVSRGWVSADREPARPDDPWLDTGDFARLDPGGHLRIEGRRTDRIVTGGENVDPAQVEAVLREHPAVVDAAVAGLPDPEWGQRVAALVVVDGVVVDGALIDGALADAPAAELEESLREHCRRRMAPFQVPKEIRRTDELPRTATGKVRREAVREALAVGEPSTKR